jgi:FMN phosphatase YigB (HAD superfamily)
MMFSPALSREFRPYKPDPAPLLHICSTWNIPPNEVVMVGDSLKDDVRILYKLFLNSLLCPMVLISVCS